MLGVLLGREELEQAAEVAEGLGVSGSRMVEEMIQAEDAEEREQVRRWQRGWVGVKIAELWVSVVEISCPPAQEGVRGEKVEEEEGEKVKMKMQGMRGKEVEANGELLLEKPL